MPIAQIDWEAIKERVDDDTAIYAFTRRQASLLLSLSEQLTWEKTFRVNEYDFSDKDDLDAEIAETQRNLIMGINLVDIIQYIDDVETLLETLVRIAESQPQPCCDGGPTSQFGEEIPPNENYPDTPPATWGEEDVVDSDDWQELVCGAAHDYVDVLKLTNNQLGDSLEDAILVVAIVAGSLAVLASAGWLLPVAYTAAAGITTALVAGATAATFAGVDEDIEDARSEIVCAIVHGSPQDIEDAIEEAVGAAAWTFFFSHKDYASHQAAMINGSVGDQALTVNRRTDCDCAVEWPEPDGNLLRDSSFESGALGDGYTAWAKTATASFTFGTGDAYDGTRWGQLDGGSGWPEKYVWQRFTAPQSGNVQLSTWCKYVGSTYGTGIRLLEYNGSTWDTKLNLSALGILTYWNYKSTQSYAITEGTQYMVQIYNGSYHKLDLVKLRYV